MNGIVINIDPVALHLGHFELRWYSIFVVLAFVLATIAGVRSFRKRGIDHRHVYNLVIWLALGGLVGARLFHILDHLDFYLANPRMIVGFQGLAIWGGLAGGGIATAIYARVSRLPLGVLADAMVPAVLVGQMVGRLACVVNGDAYGGPTSLPWAFVYVNPDAMIPDYLKGVPTHPYPVYEILWDAATLFAVLKLAPRLKANGALFLLYVSSYAVGRFLLTFVRQETVLFWGLQEAQVVSLIVLVVSIPASIFLMRRRPQATPAGQQA